MFLGVSKLVTILASTGQYCMDTRCTLGVPILVPFLASTGQYVWILGVL